MRLEIPYIDRKRQCQATEEVFGGSALKFLYGKWGAPLLNVVAKWPIVSKLYGWMQKSSLTKRKIIPFIEKFHVDAREFEKPVAEFTSFNDFFIRKLNLDYRPIAPGENVAIIPADGRYLFIETIAENWQFQIKGTSFDLRSFFKDESLAKDYTGGSAILGRLCPIDYHRFHFPLSGSASATKVINGSLYSVNPLALKWNPGILSMNKRTLCELETKAFGKVLLVEIGATFVGSIEQTYTPFSHVRKGDEKGFFQFGGSAVALFFLPGTLCLDSDLLKLSQEGLEIYCQMGQSLGKASSVSLGK